MMKYYVGRKFPFWGWYVGDKTRGLALSKAAAKRAALDWIAENRPRETPKADPPAPPAAAARPTSAGALPDVGAHLGDDDRPQASATLRKDASIWPPQ